MNKEELKKRSLRFAVNVKPIALRVRGVPGGRNAGDQLLDSSSSMAANYRAACRGRSRAEFISKLGTAVEESDETVFWLEYIGSAGFVPATEVKDHLDEAQLLRNIFAASYGTARGNYQEHLDNQRRRRSRAKP